MDNEQVLSVSIGGRTYKLRIGKDEEERIRQAARDIEKASRDYARTYAHRDTQDLLAMVALQLSLMALKSNESTKYHELELHTKLKEIEEILSET
jgi:cell division protein ZapA